MAYQKMGYIFLDRHGDIRYCALKEVNQVFPRVNGYKSKNTKHS